MFDYLLCGTFAGFDEHGFGALDELQLLVLELEGLCDGNGVRFGEGDDLSFRGDVLRLLNNVRSV
jgi:hypothetical protein